LSPRDSHPLCPQYVADLALGDEYLELEFEEIGQFLLGEDRVLSFLLPQPGPTLRSHLVGVAAAMVNERLPRRTSLTIAMAQLRKVVPAEGEAQFLTEVLEVLPLVKALEKLLLGQSPLDLTDSVAFHGVSSLVKIAL
jgi:hypothetical protein